LSEIEREVGDTKGRYVLRMNGAEAELTYSILSPTHIIADHTGVPDGMRGTGAGAATGGTAWWQMRGRRG
jgi:predicted GNAT family acetyltransferase